MSGRAITQTAATRPIMMHACDMLRRGPLFTVRSIPHRIHADGVGYEVLGLSVADTRATAQCVAARANAAPSMESALRRIIEMTAWRDSGGVVALTKLIDDIGQQAREGLAMIEGA